MLWNHKEKNKPTVDEYNELVRVLVCTRMDLLNILKENIELRQRLKEMEETFSDDRK